MVFLGIKKAAIARAAAMVVVATLASSGHLRADPSNCEACMALDDSLIDDCLDSNNCNQVPVDGGVWVLALGGLVLAYLAYGRKAAG